MTEQPAIPDDDTDTETSTEPAGRDAPRELGPAALTDHDPAERGEQTGRPAAEPAPQDPLEQPVAGGQDDGEPAQGLGAPDSW